MSIRQRVELKNRKKKTGKNRARRTHIYQSIHSLSILYTCFLLHLVFWGSAGASLSYDGANRGWQPGQVATSTQDHKQKQTTVHTRKQLINGSKGCLFNKRRVFLLLYRYCHFFSKLCVTFKICKICYLIFTELSVVYDVTSANNMAAALRRVYGVGGGGVISRYNQLFTFNYTFLSVSRWEPAIFGQRRLLA